MIESFLEKLQHSLDNGTFVKLTLSKPGGPDKDFRNVYARPVQIKGQNLLSFTLHYSTRDMVRNYPLPESLDVIRQWLGQDFLHAGLFTLEEDVSIQFSKKRNARMFVRPASHREAPSLEHDRTKKRFVGPSAAAYLREMEIMNADGEVLKSGQRKFRQINKYIEIIDALLREHPLPPDPHIVDMGSGKGYLTFALYDYLKNTLQLQPHLTGIELRPNLVEFGNRLARQVGFDRLEFIAQDIHDFVPQRIDMLIALHACDIATDVAIAKGIRSGASIIIVAPCCHKQIRKQMNCRTDLQAILKHGILEERQAELITDGIRSLLMEANGYKTKVFEFISTEHTPKNLMIVGIKGNANPEALEKVNAIKTQFGIEYHYLEKELEDWSFSQP